MMSRLLLLACGGTSLFLGLMSSGCKDNSTNPYGTTPATPSSGPSNTVVMAGSSFTPAVDTVAVGTTITWKNNDSYAHTSTSDTGVWDTGNIAGGASATTTFAAAGTYPYHCTYHVSMGMRGTIVVR